MTTAHVCSWGVSDTHASAGKAAMTGNGIVYDFSKSTEAVQAPEHNEIGQVIGQTQYDEHKTVNCTLQVAHGVTPPTRGTMIQIDGEHFYLLNSTLTESNQAYARYQATLERYHRTAANFVTMATGAFSGS